MIKVLSAEEMQEVDRLTTEKYGIPSIILMENAAHAVADVIKQKLGGSVKGKSFLILCGKGNNGGDGAALARILWRLDADVFVIILGKIEETKGDAKINFEFLEKLNKHDAIFIDYWEVENYAEFYQILENFIVNYPIDFIVDAIFGTGLKRKLKGHYGDIVHYTSQYIIHRKKTPVLSIDLPSGLYSDLSNKLGANIKADLTVTFTAPKIANVLPPASNFNGELHIANIGSPQELIDNCPSQTFLAEKQDAKDWLLNTKFSKGSYKNKRGHALLIVGSKKYSGAAVLSGNAAMQTGVGLVTVATSESALGSVAARILPEVITQGLDETEDGIISERAFTKIENLSKKADIVAIGSGLGVPSSKFQVPSSEDKNQKSKTKDQRPNLVKKVIENRKTPVVIDADGLNSLSPFDLRGSDELPLILTPHEGEFLRLLGTDNKEILNDRIKAVRDFAEKHQVILVLKGERTLIAEPNGKVVINPTGNSGLGKAGNGDNLTGIITGFVAQAVQCKVGIFETVVAAVYIAGLAGDIAERKFGKRTMSASDVRESLLEAFEEIENG